MNSPIPLSFAMLSMRQKALFVFVVFLALLSFLIFFWWNANRSSVVGDVDVVPEEVTLIQDSAGIAPNSSAGIQEAQSSDLDRLQVDAPMGDLKKQSSELDVLRVNSGTLPASAEAQSAELDTKNRSQ